MPGALEALAELRRRRVRLGIISNTGGMTRRAIIETLPRDFDLGAFEAGLVIFSSEVGVEKPDPHIFRLAVERTALPAEECLFCTENLLHTLAAGGDARGEGLAAARKRCRHVSQRPCRVRPARLIGRATRRLSGNQIATLKGDRRGYD